MRHCVSVRLRPFRAAIACAALALVPIAAPPADAAEGTKLLRFPDIHGDVVAFSYAGDLWTAPAAGGTATRITAHPGLELFPKFSPDGRWIAFTGQYDGDEQVYVVPAIGGVPKQLTFYPARGPLPPRWGYDNQVYDWTQDGKRVLFRSMRSGHDLTDTQLFLVSVDGGLPEALPMPESGAGDLSPDETQVVYTPLVRDFRSWKRYEGGWAQELYLFDLDSYAIEQVTDHPRADRDPMWIGDTVYFTSDRDGHFNLYAYDVPSGATEQLTTHRPSDVRWPSDDGEARIVYELDGELVVYDIASGEERELSITVPDDGVSMRPSRVSVAGNVEGYALSPKGERALIVARGDVFTVPIEHGPTRNLTKTSWAHDKDARWSPDGSKIAFLSDRTGEEEIWIVEQDGSGEPRRLTEGGKAMRYSPDWSPDGEHIAFSDKDGKLYVVSVDTGKTREIADEKNGQLTDYVWSPCGSHIAFTLSNDTGFRSLYVWTEGEKAPRRLTGDMYNEFSPAWGPAGDYLFFLSNRDYVPQIGDVEWNYVLDRNVSVFAMSLRDDVPHPFPPRSDEVEVEADEGDDAEGEGDEADAAEEEKDEKDGEDREPIAIDFDGIAERVARVPVEADNYAGLSAKEGHLVWVRTGPFYYGRSSDVSPEIHVFSMEDRKAEVLATGIGGYALSHDGSKLLTRQGGAFKLYDATPKGKDSAKAVSTAGLEVDRVPREEWEQIFDEVWRRFRDFFYVENMHGYDWKALRDEYRPLLEHVAHRSDLNYVISEMIAELNVGHAYISGGDWDTPERAQVALPGAEFELDAKAGRYRVATIFDGHNEEPLYRSPLTEVGVDVSEGDYVLAVDGEPLDADDNPYRALRHRADRPVTLTVHSEPTFEGAREVTFTPLTSETSLRYLRWIEGNRKRVDEMSDGELGYLHIPNMGADGIREFIKWFYPQIRKQGLVIDVRGNGGGNVSQMLIERLNRELLGTRFARTVETARTYPAWVFHGHLVCLLNEDSASDGDIFPHMFRQAGLGPLIGKRSWGGVVGITNRGTLIDGGTVNVPEFGTNGVDGSWIIEGYGVDPDIEIANDPKSVLDGRDPQLEKGVEILLEKIRENPMRLPEEPAPAPVKTP